MSRFKWLPGWALDTDEKKVVKAMYAFRRNSIGYIDDEHWLRTSEFVVDDNGKLIYPFCQFRNKHHPYDL